MAATRFSRARLRGDPVGLFYWRIGIAQRLTKGVESLENDVEISGPAHLEQTASLTSAAWPGLLPAASRRSKKTSLIALVRVAYSSRER